jgi:hypothetical protein
MYPQFIPTHPHQFSTLFYLCETSGIFGMIPVITSNFIIPATPSNPSIPVKRTSKFTRWGLRIAAFQLWHGLHQVGWNFPVIPEGVRRPISDLADLGMISGVKLGGISAAKWGFKYQTS